MTCADVRDLDVPSVVAAVRNTDKFAALDDMLEQSPFWDTLEAQRLKQWLQKAIQIGSHYHAP